MDIFFFPKRDRIASVIEMSRKDPEKTILIIRVENYFQKRTNKEAFSLIESLNNRFSKNTEDLFYNQYALPPEQEVNNYKKVYAMTRIFIDGNTLFEKNSKLQ